MKRPNVGKFLFNMDMKALVAGVKIISPVVNHMRKDRQDC